MQISLLQIHLSSLAINSGFIFYPIKSLDRTIFNLESDEAIICIECIYTQDNATVTYQSREGAEIKVCDSNEQVLETVSQFI